ncbi:unnamed protein product [Euphydryas editha]|uniref:Reverse transcriptase n=1 Tax=Euphydryas editha TaxID=104508 RepID=A0AAU9V0B5_EUPED|nr:unnamed protein product [Euphydryas editha]
MDVLRKETPVKQEKVLLKNLFIFTIKEERKGKALAVSLDIAKAFDREWHEALLTKLPSYGLPENCKWITSRFFSRQEHQGR